MSIRPVDMQVMIPKTSEINRNQIHETRPEVAQSQFASQVQRDVTRAQTSVTQSHQSEAVDKDGRNQQQGRGKQQRKKQGAKDTQGFMDDSRGMIDISV